ncbi:AAA family ATPase [Rhodanobacter sp. FW106-PBR-LB-2-11]|uniref:AAA family ATPase n=1 Tax=Rhodanobacter sp. FW106-PBR-LB-2-11 TaxID=1524463 RepID=UPI0034E3D18B
MSAETVTKPSTGSRKRPPSYVVQVLQRLPGLVDAARWGQAQRLTEITDEVAALIEGSSPSLARKLRASRPMNATRVIPPPTDLLDVLQPAIGLDDVVLPEAARASCAALIEEQQNREALAAWNVPPRHKILLSGPPGNGKTMLACALANALGTPYLVARYGGLVDSYLGNTGKNLDKIFEFAATGPCLLFLDEFDSIGVNRAKAGDVGELRRITNQLLLLIDRMPPHVVLVCATNQPGLVDDALRRRFDTSIALGDPSHELRMRLAMKELGPNRCNGTDLRGYAPAIAADPQASVNLDAISKACMAVRRKHALESLSAAQSGETAASCQANHQLPFGPPLPNVAS